MGMGLGPEWCWAPLGSAGMGTFLGYDLLGFRGHAFCVLPATGFFTVGFMMAIFNYSEKFINAGKGAQRMVMATPDPRPVF